MILEAMAAGNCVLVNDHPPNAETVGDAGAYFSGNGVHGGCAIRAGVRGEAGAVEVGQHTNTSSSAMVVRRSRPP